MPEGLQEDLHDQGRAPSTAADPTGSDGAHVLRKASARLRVPREQLLWRELWPLVPGTIGGEAALGHRGGRVLSRGTRCLAQDPGKGGRNACSVSSLSVLPLPPTSLVRPVGFLLTLVGGGAKVWLQAFRLVFETGNPFIPWRVKGLST